MTYLESDTRSKRDFVDYLLTYKNAKHKIYERPLELFLRDEYFEFAEGEF